jgi:hypothetical protein
MSKRAKIQQQRLDELEAEFQPLLISCLRRCAAGWSGLLGRYSDEHARYLKWAESDRLKELSERISLIRMEFGQPSPILARYLELCSQSGPHVPGEPSQAAAFLDEISSGEWGTE